MSNTWFEQTRSVLENLELIDKSIVLELIEKDKRKSDSVLIDWKISNLIESKQRKCLDASLLLTDTEFKNADAAVLVGKKSVSQGKNADIWINFYEKIKEIKDYHRKHQTVVPNLNTVEYIRDHVFDPPLKAPDFTPEEGMGKYIDMDKQFQEFLNLNIFESREEKKRHDYLQYLRDFDNFDQIEQATKEKNSKQYRKYLENVVSYLKNYFAKVQPLTDTSGAEQQNLENFEQQWEEGTFKGWVNTDDIDKQTIDEIENDPLYCKFCKTLFANTNIKFHHSLGKKHQRNEKNYQKEQEKLKPLDAQEEQEEHEVIKAVKKKKQLRKELAYLESQVMRYKELLGDIIEDTMNNVRKKQTQTGNLYMEDQDQEIDEEVLAASDEDEPIYNPKNLPLGWDGKPIPYWLYKLHGLGLEYKCEICGNYSYWGRRAFERHFQEWRHNYGMRCLKIPNTIHFREITSIKQAQQLHEKLLKENYQLQFRPEQEEQYEDGQGNVMDKKTYKDLEKQGLLD